MSYQNTQHWLGGKGFWWKNWSCRRRVMDSILVTNSPQSQLILTTIVELNYEANREGLWELGSSWKSLGGKVHIKRSHCPEIIHKPNVLNLTELLSHKYKMRLSGDSRRIRARDNMKLFKNTSGENDVSWTEKRTMDYVDWIWFKQHLNWRLARCTTTSSVCSKNNSDCLSKNNAKLDEIRHHPLHTNFPTNNNETPRNARWVNSHSKNLKIQR